MSKPLPAGREQPMSPREAIDILLLVALSDPFAPDDVITVLEEMKLDIDAEGMVAAAPQEGSE